MNPLPTLFISHGSPMHALQAGRAGAAWAAFGRGLPRPRAVLIASAHWESEWPMLTTSARPETIHDFAGFPQELYKLRYAATGAPDIAQQAIDLIHAGGMTANGNGCRGLDHGAWVPLLHMYPDADIPVAQVSVQTQLGAAHHLQLGTLLAPLRAEGVLIIGSGHMTHNLREWMQFVNRHGMTPREAAVAPYVDEFRRWIDGALQRDDRAALSRYRELAPAAVRAHPTEEHFLPLLVAFGAAGNAPQVERIDAGVDAEALAMDAYLFRPQPHSASS